LYKRFGGTSESLGHFYERPVDFTRRPESCPNGSFAAFLQKRLLTERGTCFIYDNITKFIENFYERCEKTFDWRDFRRGRVDCLSARTGAGRAQGGAEHLPQFSACFLANIDASAAVNRTDNSVTVYITKSVGKYHRYSCGYLSNKTK
jgi:hypothetical protein